jgi:hypothetical protein
MRVGCPFFVARAATSTELPPLSVNSSSIMFLSDWARSGAEELPAASGPWQRRQASV